MALQFSVDVRNARADAVETAIGTSPILKLRTGAPPADCGTADSGTVLSTVTCPSNWMADASGGTKGIAGTWLDASADASGTVGHFRIYDSGGTDCKIQGTVSLSGGDGDMYVDDLDFVAGQSYSVTTFTIVEGNG